MDSNQTQKLSDKLNQVESSKHLGSMSSVSFVEYQIKESLWPSYQKWSKHKNFSLNLLYAWI